MQNDSARILIWTLPSRLRSDTSVLTTYVPSPFWLMSVDIGSPSTSREILSSLASRLTSNETSFKLLSTAFLVGKIWSSTGGVQFEFPALGVPPLLVLRVEELPPPPPPPLFSPY